MLEQSVVIQNRLGLHARASAAFVSIAGNFQSDITLGKGDMKVNGKSIMGIMMLAGSKGTTLVLSADGEDEVMAIKALVDLINQRFGERD
ncbi:MAG: HPr family phosphocarrier protein [Mariprofundaceae bacterium]|nr:HPr family phosphocarrier protein [Mariprofundaceae bacterium]